MKRDLRDPQQLGEAYTALREKGVDIATAVRLPVDDFDAQHEGPIEKYGDPRDSLEVWATIRVA